MAAVDNIVKLNIVQQTTSVPTTTTTIPLLLGPTNPGWDEDDKVHAYTSASEMLSDGFTSTSPEYIFALALTAQQTVPDQFFVGRRTGGREPGKPERDRVTVQNVLPNYVYRLTVNGRLYSYTSSASDAAPQIHQGLYRAISNDAAVATVHAELTGGSANLDIVGNMDGAALTLTAVDSNLQVEQTQAPEAGELEALTVDDLEAITTQNSSWYALLLIQPKDDEILTAAKWISPRKLLAASSADKAIFDAQSTSDIAAQLHAKSLPTLLVASPASAGLGLDSGWLGGQLPQVPGSNTWMFKPVAGFEPDNLTATQIATAAGVPVAGVKGKCANVYVSEGGVPMMMPGVLSDGTFVDIKIGVDWLYFNLSSAIFGALQGAIGKIPYTDLGVALLKSAVSEVLGKARDNGLVQAGFTIDAAKVADVPASQRANRIAPTIKFSCVLQGAIHSVSIVGNVSV